MRYSSLMNLQPWLGFLVILRLCCAAESPLSRIDPDDFDLRATLPGIFLMTFCIDWFEPCKALHRQLVDAAEALRQVSQVGIYEVDCSEHAKFCASLDVLSFPTIRVFDHQQWSRYRGPQRTSQIVTHVLKQVMEPVIELDEQRLAVMKNLSLPLMVMTGDQNDYASLDILTALAKAELSQNFFVGVMWDLSFPNIHHKTTPSVTVFNSLDETTPRYGGRFDREGLLGFASLVSQPLVRQFDMSSLVSFMKSGLPIGMVYSTKEDERKALADVLSVVAMKHREDINFATVDAIKNEFSLEPLGLQVDQLPAFVIQTDDHVFKFSPDMTITPEAIEDFIQRTLYSQTTPIAAQK